MVCFVGEPKSFQGKLFSLLRKLRRRWLASSRRLCSIPLFRLVWYLSRQVLAPPTHELTEIYHESVLALAYRNATQLDEKLIEEIREAYVSVADNSG